jgi:hypothetical protein
MDGNDPKGEEVEYGDAVGDVVGKAIESPTTPYALP